MLATLLGLTKRLGKVSATLSWGRTALGGVSDLVWGFGRLSLARAALLRHCNRGSGQSGFSEFSVLLWFHHFKMFYYIDSLVLYEMLYIWWFHLWCFELLSSSLSYEFGWFHDFIGYSGFCHFGELRLRFIYMCTNEMRYNWIWRFFYIWVLDHPIWECFMFAILARVCIDVSPFEEIWFMETM